MKNKPLVSVIMNCYNYAHYIDQSVPTVLAQTYQNWEIIFWDNQSKDSSAEVLKKYSDPRIKYFYADEFLPLGQARNKAIEKASGEFIAFLDIDDLWLPEKLEKQIPYFENPKVGLVISDTIFFNENSERQIYKNNPPPTGNVFRELLSAYFISLETAVIRRSALDTLDHWFDTRFNMIEEMDLFIRIAYQYELAFAPEVLAKWRIHKTSWTFNKMEQFPVERELFLEKMNKLVSNFEETYADEIDSFRKIIALEKAKVAWKKGNKSEARHFIRPYIGQKKFLAYYGLMFFPFSVYEKISEIQAR